MHRKLKRFIAIIAIGTFLVFLTVGFYWYLRFMRTTGITPGLIARLVVDNGVKLKSSGSRTNVLILGSGGGEHEGADLTDTMMVLSVEAQKKSVALISIPRDTWSDTLKDRVNTAYYYGEEKKKGGGMLLAKVIVEDVIGMPIHYGFLIDFSGFKKIIDLLGGVDVNVTRAFTDNEYPIAGKERDTCPGDPTNRCVYESIHFDEGKQHMNGEVALKYARSRHAEDEEGSDFARSRRQQDIMIALKDKIVHPIQWFSFSRLTTLPRILDDAMDTDMNIGELATVGKWFIKTKESAVKKIAFDTLLIEPPVYLYGGRYVLVPLENWDSVHSYLRALVLGE